MYATYVHAYIYMYMHMHIYVFALHRTLTHTQTHTHPHTLLPCTFVPHVSRNRIGGESISVVMLNTLFCVLFFEQEERTLVL